MQVLTDNYNITEGVVRINGILLPHIALFLLLLHFIHVLLNFVVHIVLIDTSLFLHKYQFIVNFDKSLHTYP